MPSYTDPMPRGHQRSHPGWLIAASNSRGNINAADGATNHQPVFMGSVRSRLKQAPGSARTDPVWKQLQLNIWS